MTVYIGLLRGINVGGHNILPMQALRQFFEAHDCSHVQTYIQSGNVVFSYDRNLREFPEKIVVQIENSFGFRPKLLVIEHSVFAAVVAANPFTDIERNPKLLHVWFLSEPATNPDYVSVESKLAESETYALEGNAFYLHAPEGIGRSKLAGDVEKFLGVDATARNWRTVIKLNELSAACKNHL